MMWLQMILMMGVFSWSQFDAAPLVVGEDCNENGISDEIDLLPERFGFQPQTTFSAELGARDVVSRDYLGAPIDLDGDGFTDLIVANAVSNSISIFLNNRDGTFRTVSSHPVGEMPQSLAVADFNRDGQIDVAAAEFFGRSVSVLFGIGSGDFEAAVTYPVEFKAKAIVAGDFNGDDYPDLAVTLWDAPFSGRVLALLNQQDGAFQTSGPFRAGREGGPTDITAGDVTGNGVVDLVVLIDGGNFSEVLVLPGIGDGTFPIQLKYAIGFPYWDIAPSTAVLADLDGDGDLDIAVANWWYELTGWGDLRLLTNLGDGTFGEPFISEPLGPGIQDVNAVDIDFDGDVDLVALLGTHCCSEIEVMLNQGTMTFRGPERFDVDDKARSIASGDFDLDGRIDFATANVEFDDNVSVLLGTTDGPAFDHDCNLNDIPDGCEIADGTSEDCNDNGFPDQCEPDCNNNGVPDDCDVDNRESRDGNRNGIPDECEGCFGDFNRNGMRDEIDLLVLEGVFGCRVGDGNWPCDEADIDGDGQVNPVDLGLLQALMGPCPEGEKP